jgi:hypothetical protein
MDTAERLKRLARAWEAWDHRAKVDVSFNGDSVAINPTVFPGPVSKPTLEDAIQASEEGLKQRANELAVGCESAARDARDRLYSMEKILAEGSA